MAGIWPNADVHAHGLATAGVSAMLAASDRARSDALVVVKDGATIIARSSKGGAGAIELMSITKSVTALAIGCLLADGAISSVDAPVATWCAGWRNADLSRISLRHIMTHTSGLRCTRSQGGEGVAGIGGDCREYQSVHRPGVRFEYNNEATEILSDIVRAVAAKPLAAYVHERIFEPMQISEWSWAADGRGNHHVAYGLALGAMDLARVGLMLLQEGRWNGRVIVPAAWVRQMTTPAHPANPFYGLLWYLRGDPQHRPPLRRPSGPDVWSDPWGAFYAHGWLGQFLVVYPAANVVAVRLHRTTADGGAAENRRSGFATFLEVLEQTMGRPS